MECEHSSLPNTVDLPFSTTYEAPPSFHVDEARWTEMIQEGYNATVLKDFTFKLGNRTFQRGQIPAYHVVTHYCTCAVKKEQLLTVVDHSGSIRLDQMAM